MSETLNCNNEVLCFGNFKQSVEILRHEGGYLLMDVDGCLIHGGLETAGNKKTLEEWGKDNTREIEFFRENIKSLQSIGIKVGLSTGRGLEFSKRFLGYFFPEDKGVKLDESIVEGGLVILDGSLGKYRLADNVDKKSADLLEKNRNRLIEIGKALGGLVEEGKLLALSFNPPMGIDGKRNTDEFREIFKKNLDKNLVGSLTITNSTTAVDITPRGVDKMTAIENLIGENGKVIYLGDGKNDETSMKNSKVIVSLAPGNSHPDIKKFIESGEKAALMSNENELAGTNQMLSYLVRLISN